MEATVKALKHLVAKTACKGDLTSPEFCRGLLEWRNTPKEHGFSPAQLLYGRSLRSTVPAHHSTLGPIDLHRVDHALESSQERKEVAKGRQDQKARVLPSFRVGQRFRIQDPKSKKWNQTGVIVQVAQNWSVWVELSNGRRYWRNRKMVGLDRSPETHML